MVPPQDLHRGPRSTNSAAMWSGRPNKCTPLSPPGLNFYTTHPYSIINRKREKCNTSSNVNTNDLTPYCEVTNLNWYISQGPTKQTETTMNIHNKGIYCRELVT